MLILVSAYRLIKKKLQYNLRTIGQIHEKVNRILKSYINWMKIPTQIYLCTEYDSKV